MHVPPTSLFALAVSASWDTCSSFQARPDSASWEPSGHFGLPHQAWDSALSMARLSACLQRYHWPHRQAGLWNRHRPGPSGLPPTSPASRAGLFHLSYQSGQLPEGWARGNAAGHYHRHGYLAHSRSCWSPPPDSSLAPAPPSPWGLQGKWGAVSVVGAGD